MTEHHELSLASADPFGLTYQRHNGKPTTVKVDKISFTIYPGRDRGYKGCHIYGQRVLASGKLGAKVSRYLNVKYDRELWDQVPDDIKATMRAHGFDDSTDPQ